MSSNEDMQDEIYANNFLDCSTEKKEGHIVKYIKASTANQVVIDAMEEVKIKLDDLRYSFNSRKNMEIIIKNTIQKHKGE